MVQLWKMCGQEALRLLSWLENNWPHSVQAPKVATLQDKRQAKAAGGSGAGFYGKCATKGWWGWKHDIPCSQGQTTKSMGLANQAAIRSRAWAASTLPARSLHKTGVVLAMAAGGNGAAAIEGKKGWMDWWLCWQGSLMALLPLPQCQLYYNIINTALAAVERSKERDAAVLHSSTQLNCPDNAYSFATSWQ